MRCAICGSGRLSPVGDLISGEKWMDRLSFRFDRPGILKPRPMFTVGFARACRDCGALFPFLDENERVRLDEQADKLTDVEGAP